MELRRFVLGTPRLVVLLAYVYDEKRGCDSNKRHGTSNEVKREPPVALEFVRGGRTRGVGS